MKIKPEHYEILRKAMQKTLDDNPGIKERYKRKGYQKNGLHGISVMQHNLI